MNQPRIYIDGQEGTTGLRIREMLAPRDDLDLLLIPAAERKNAKTRAEFFERADVAILCLPDEAAGEAVELCGKADTAIIDTSTARRVHPDWVYGLPELGPEQRAAIQGAQRVANPGCYPVGFILAVRPLIQAGLLSPATPLAVNAVSGYSGGGRKMIEAYREARRDASGDAALPLCMYSLEDAHKHIPEMQRFGLVEHPPIFAPAVAHAYCGMLVSTPIPATQFAQPGGVRERIHEIWRDHYRDLPFVRPVAPDESAGALRDGKFLDLGGCNHTNRVELFVFGDEVRGPILVGRLDNLGKGASGNAVQCLNLMLGLDESAGLQP